MTVFASFRFQKFMMGSSLCLTLGLASSASLADFTCVGKVCHTVDNAVLSDIAARGANVAVVQFAGRRYLRVPIVVDPKQIRDAQLEGVTGVLLVGLGDANVTRSIIDAIPKDLFKHIVLKDIDFKVAEDRRDVANAIVKKLGGHPADSVVFADKTANMAASLATAGLKAREIILLGDNDWNPLGAHAVTLLSANGSLLTYFDKPMDIRKFADGLISRGEETPAVNKWFISVNPASESFDALMAVPLVSQNTIISINGGVTAPVTRSLAQFIAGRSIVTMGNIRMAPNAVSPFWNNLLTAKRTPTSKLQILAFSSGAEDLFDIGNHASAKASVMNVIGQLNRVESLSKPFLPDDETHRKKENQFPLLQAL